MSLVLSDFLGVLKTLVKSRCATEKAEIASLKADLEKAIIIPDISHYLTSRKQIEPRSVVNTYGQFDLVCADEAYYALSKRDWNAVLALVFEQVRKVLNTWVAEISDCDDWALLMAALMSSAFKKSGVERQGAFCVIWSNCHAYNGYVTNERKLYLFEPQNGQTINELNQALADPYKTRSIWFLS